MIDFLAGTAGIPSVAPVLRPTILLLDSGIGGLTVMREVKRARPDAAYVYAADDAGFPYGAWREAPLIARVADLVDRLVAAHAPDLAIIACNTISTLVLPVLRARHPIPFVGTVPAIKPAVAASRSGRISVLATPGTVARDYTHGLIAAYGGDCRVDLVGSTRLAAMAEAEMSGEPVPDRDLLAEIAPCFVDCEGRRTDVVVLACTHYPILIDRMRRFAPWPVGWIDPAPAIARRVVQILGEPSPMAGPPPEPGLAVFTGPGLPSRALRHALHERGLDEIETDVCPL